MAGDVAVRGAGAPGHTSLITPIPPTSRSRRLQYARPLLTLRFALQFLQGRAKRRGWLVPQQLRELGDIDGYAPGLFAGQ